MPIPAEEAICQFAKRKSSHRRAYDYHGGYSIKLGRVLNSHNVLRLGEGGDFTTELYSKRTFQIYEELSCEARTRHFLPNRCCASAFFL